MYVLHEQNATVQTENDDYDINDDNDDIFTSPSMDESLKHAMLIATLAESFNLTSLKPFQKTVINATLNGQDTLVVQPTGSGKSICLQFPPVYLNKKAIIVTPTISLMQDQVHKLNGIGVQSVLWGSAHLINRLKFMHYSQIVKNRLYLSLLNG